MGTSIEEAICKSLLQLRGAGDTFVWLKIWNYARHIEDEIYKIASSI